MGSGGKARDMRYLKAARGRTSDKRHLRGSRKDERHLISRGHEERRGI